MAASLTEVLSAMQLTNQILSKIQQTLANAGTVGSVPRSYLAGANTSNNAGTPNTKVDIAAGIAADSGNTVLINSTGVLTVDFTTVGANGLDTGAIGASTWYNIFLISQTGNINAAAIASISLTPALPTNYAYYRRIGAVRTTAGSVIRAFVQDGDYFQWVTQIADISVNTPGTAAVTATITVPTGVRVVAQVIFSVQNLDAGIATCLLVTDLATTDLAPSNVSSQVSQVATAAARPADVNTEILVRTNTSAQIRYRFNNSNANVSLNELTLGWFDSRGKNN